ncbi:hypothetical protein IAD21_02591 [Abditibacteriota bacterium]|nr:hypothetical protein IAD21_02591 [Abditibacteriota bacterium]
MVAQMNIDIWREVRCLYLLNPFLSVFLTWLSVPLPIQKIICVHLCNHRRSSVDKKFLAAHPQMAIVAIPLKISRAPSTRVAPNPSPSQRQPTMAPKTILISRPAAAYDTVPRE